MAKKTYRTYYLKSLDLYLTNGDGERVVIEFRGGIQVDSTARFTTRDPGIQELIESTNGFGRDYYIESVKEDEAAAKTAEPEEKATDRKAEEKPVLGDVKGMERFRNLVEMKNRMAELGIELADSANYQQAKAAAAAAGYDFQIKKK